MSTQPAQQGQGTVSRMPQVVIEEGKFEGKDVQETRLTISGSGKLVPVATPGHDDHRVVTVDDILTVQIDVKVRSVHYDADGNGNFTRTQVARPIEGTATIVDVVRAKDTRIR